MFKLKYLPDGSPSKFKARYFVRGDIKKEVLDYVDTYTSVVQRSTIRLLITMVLSNGWTTKLVNYTNVFVQVEIKEEVYVEQPKGFENIRDKVSKVLRLLNSIYGLKQAPLIFFEKPKEGLEERGFRQSNYDHTCL